MADKAHTLFASENHPASALQGAVVLVAMNRPISRLGRARCHFMSAKERLIAWSDAVRLIWSELAGILA